MSPSLAKEMVQTMLNEIEEDLKNTEGINGDYSEFSAIAWIESPRRKYASILQGVAKLKPQTALSVLLLKLRAYCKLINNSYSCTSSIQIKKLLIICQLILHLPVYVINSKSKESLNAILSLSLFNKGGDAARQLIVESVSEVARVLVMHGANPIPFTYPVSSVNELSNLFRLCTNVNYTVATFKSTIHLAQVLAPNIQADMRSKFVDKLYHAIFRFFIRSPKEHKVLLEQGIDDAQKLMDAILSWKSIDIEYMSLFGALMPFCRSSLQDLQARKKGNQFSNILNMMSQFKQSKESARVAVALGILEIINCVTLVTPNENELFRAFDEFLFTYRPKFEEWLFKPRKKPFFTGYLVNLFLPRYAALEFYKRQKPDGIACKKVLELAEHKYGNIGLVVYQSNETFTND
ncbi:uncharacterized protein GO595_001428 [Histomonas meleagridis]|uniref:uncharacterized protein n=1 Tax=Histomonas meleagridis TaxID=135588 RepID=UPI003559DD95|nr:hypothetical protein GO595_001428 [Histomonas meleagridis]